MFIVTDYFCSTRQFQTKKIEPKVDVDQENIVSHIQPLINEIFPLFSLIISELNYNKGKLTVSDSINIY